MDPSRWQRLQSLFERAEALPEGERTEFLSGECSDDPALASQVRSLLDVTSNRSEFIQAPIRGAAGRLENPHALEPGTRVGAYEIVGEIGRGGMGTVHRAKRVDEEFDADVAIKFLHSAHPSPELFVRFRRERQILAKLDHPNIARLLDGGETEDGRLYVILEHVSGEPIDAYCSRHGLSIRERLELFLDVCAAVDYAHRNLVIHRDIKPSNILVGAHGPKLLDFGIAKLTGEEVGDADLTRSFARVLTPAYASPEQLRGDTVTTSTDVYSLGVLLFELLTGTRPYGSKTSTREDLEHAIRELQPARPSTVVGESDSVSSSTSDSKRTRRLLQGDLDNIILMALRKEPDRRYGSVKEFAEDIQRHLDGFTVRAVPEKWSYTLRKFARRNRVPVGISVVLVTALALTVTFYTFRLQEERDNARIARELADDQREIAEQEKQNAEDQREIAEQEKQNAEDQRRVAEGEKEKAELEAFKAKQAADFLVDVLASPDPAREQGEVTTARDILERGRVRIDESLAEYPLVRAEMLTTMGRAYRTLSEYETARELVERGYALRREHLGENHLDTTKSLFERGIGSTLAGDHASAYEDMKRCLDAREQILDAPNEFLVATLKFCGYLAVQLQKLDEAEPYIVRGLAMARELWPDEDHDDTAELLRNLAALRDHQGRTAEAIALGTEALEMSKRVLGELHPRVITTTNDLGSFYISANDHANAEATLRLAVEKMRKVYGADHSFLADALQNLGVVFTNQGKNDEAETAYMESLAIRRTTLGDRHFSVAQSLCSLGLIQERGDDLDGAYASYDEALSIFREILPAGHWGLAFGLSGVGRVLVRQGKTDDAEPLLLEAVKVARANFPDPHWRIASFKDDLAGCYVAQQRYEEAEPLLLSALDVFTTQQGADSRAAVAGRRLVRELYLAWDKPDEAAKYAEPGE